MYGVKDLSDEEVAHIAQTKNKEIYSELVIRYENRLKKYIGYLTKKEKLTEDIVQEALIKGFVNLQSFDTKRKFSSWIYRIAHNEAMNQLKKRKRLLNIDILGDIFESKEKVEEEFEKLETRKILKQNLNKIPLKYSEVLVLYYLEEKSYKEISDILRVPIGTVGTWVKRGLSSLKKEYEK